MTSEVMDGLATVGEAGPMSTRTTSSTVPTRWCSASHNTAKPTGRRHTGASVLHLTVEDGLITRHHVYEDSLAVAPAFGAA